MRKPKTPTLLQAEWIRRIAQHDGLMVTYNTDGPKRYNLLDGPTVPAETAERLIRNGWLRSEADGLFGLPQIYRARKPNG